MGFIFQRRLNLGKGLGFNVSKSGVSPSVRTKFGTIGAKGFSIRTGIPGFYYRKRWSGKRSGGLIDFILFGLIFLFFFLTWEIFVLIFSFVFNIFKWLVLTIYDLIMYVIKSSKKAENNELIWNETQEKYVKSNDDIKIPNLYSKIKPHLTQDSISDIDYGLYLSIDELATPLSEIVKTIERDMSFIENLKNSKNEVTIPLLLLFDVYLIFEICTEQELINKDSIELFGLAFLGYKVYNPKVADDYDELKTLLDKDRESYYNFCNHLISAKNHKNEDLSLLKLLIIHKHNTLDEYIYSLKQYAKLIVKIDLNITSNEKKAIKKIDELIDNQFEINK